MAADTPSKSKWPRRILFGVVFVFLGVNFLGAMALFYMSSSVPDLDEDQAGLTGLSGPVELRRDASGVLWVNADSSEDASFGLGYAHAQDRLYQMEMMRRIGSGRLHELIGESGLRFDKLLRTLGLYRLAEQNVARLSEEAQAHLRAYAAGVNAYLDRRSGALPPELTILLADPEPWTPADSLVWGRLMALQLSGNWFAEITRARMLKAGLTPADLELLYSPFPGNEQSRLAPDLAALVEMPDTLLATLADAVHPAIQPRLASNAWAVSGDGTPGGKPVLAGDPHLGFQTPNLWYMARLEAPGFSRVGAFVPGVPFLIIGHNGRVAWSMTTTHSDTQDLFIETVDPNDPSRYLTPNGWAPFETRVETFELGGETIEHIVRTTRHGPVISDARAGAADATPDGTVLALASPILEPDDGTAQALFDMAASTDAASFVEALRGFHAPQQNVVFADIEGAFGVISAGRVPVRKSGDGFLPAKGEDGSQDWIGWAAFEDLPGALNPASGAVVNANNHVTGRNPDLDLGREFDAPYRYQRILELLADGDHSPTRMAEIQLDTTSLFARAMLRHLVPAIDQESEPDPLVAGAVRRVQRWDGDMTKDAPEPLLFAAWIRRLQEKLFADELGPLADDYDRPRAATLIRVLTTEPAWCDDKTTNDIETCTQIVRDSLTAAIADIQRLSGPGDWKWGELHKARFEHQIWGRIPWLGEKLMAVSPTGGGDYTISRGSWGGPDDDPFRHRHGAGLRVVFDLADLDASLFSPAVGASGNLFSEFYVSWQADWAAGRTRTIPATPTETSHTLRLEP
jgi:penicillin amidase